LFGDLEYLSTIIVSNSEIDRTFDIDRSLLALRAFVVSIRLKDLSLAKKKPIFLKASLKAM